MTAPGAVALLNDYANVPLPKMVVNAVQAVVDAANLLNASYMDVYSSWLTDYGGSPPAPIQYAVTEATIDLKVTLAFNLDQQDDWEKATKYGASARTGSFISRFVKARAYYATTVNERHQNKFNLTGEAVTTIHVRIAPVFQPTPSGS
jgi:hypothetical protein